MDKFDKRNLVLHYINNCLTSHVSLEFLAFLYFLDAVYGRLYFAASLPGFMPDTVQEVCANGFEKSASFTLLEVATPSSQIP
jgi:hypothetical protein